MNDETRHILKEQRQFAQSSAEMFAGRHGEELEAYRLVVNQAVGDAADRLRSRVTEISSGNQFAGEIIADAAEYVDWMTWMVWDMPQFAVAVKPDPAVLRSRLASSVLVYFAGRIIDDFLDRHFLYRGRVTLMATLAEKRSDRAEPQALSIIVALLMCFEGIAETGPSQAALVIDSARKLLVGILMERSPRGEWSPEFYERLVELKNVDYWRILYAGLDPDLKSPLYPFLCRYYAFAQVLNDLQDAGRDEAQGRPNISLIIRRAEGRDSYVARHLIELGQLADGLPETERAIARVKLAEAHDEVRRLGMFADPVESQPHPPLVLSWLSEASEFVERIGPDSLEDVACPVCGANESRTIFRKQGFAYERCDGCSHIYVSPRLCTEVRRQLNRTDEASEDAYLETQRIYGEYLCRVLRAETTGSRLLDLGFGSGYLLRMARAYGFQVYGVDAAPAATNLSSMFGRRLAVADLPDDDLPWGSFDIVVMNHVLEHIAEPRELLSKLGDAMTAKGIVYAAAPDSDSWQFRIFGRKWDAVSPLAHVQFFNEASLTRLLAESGFTSVRRVRTPPLKGRHRQRWMTLFRDLGGDEAGEVALLATRT